MIDHIIMPVMMKDHNNISIRYVYMYMQNDAKKMYMQNILMQNMNHYDYVHDHCYKSQMDL